MTDVIGGWAPGATPTRPPGNSARSSREPWAGPAGSPTFVLSGGGNLGALQVGMMYALVETGLRPGMIVGTSVGAVNGAFFASRPDLSGIAEMARLWSSLRRRDVLGVDIGAVVGSSHGRPRHLFDSSPLRRILDTFVTFRRLEDAPIPLTVVATALGTGEAVILSSGDATTALLASSAVPRLLPAVEIDGRLLVDGAAAADVPVREALSLGARDLYVLPTAPAQVAALMEQTSASGITTSGTSTSAKTEGFAVPTVHVVPPPDMHIPLARLGQSQDLVRLGYDQARAWLDGAPLPGAPRTAKRVGRGPRFSFRPRIPPVDQPS